MYIILIFISKRCMFYLECLWIASGKYFRIVDYFGGGGSLSARQYGGYKFLLNDHMSGFVFSIIS